MAGHGAGEEAMSRSAAPEMAKCAQNIGTGALNRLLAELVTDLLEDRLGETADGRFRAARAA